MNNRFKNPNLLISVLKGIGLDARQWQWNTEKRGWIVMVYISAHDIDDIPTGDLEDRIYAEGASVPDNKILGYYRIPENGNLSLGLSFLSQYRETHLRNADDALTILKIEAWNTKVRRKLFKIRRLIKELIQESSNGK